MSPGQVLDAELLKAAEGDTLELDRVLLFADGDKITVGTPTIEGAKIVATLQENGKGKKVRVFKYKAKVRYTRNKGHRQPYSRLLIDKIEMPGAAPKPACKPRRTKKEVTEEVSADGA